jgi:hypothetical protein
MKAIRYKCDCCGMWVDNAAEWDMEGVKQDYCIFCNHELAQALTEKIVAIRKKGSKKEA